jgi:Zn finger protein HypA/HybF involved in hydrogenase expression
MQSSLKDALNAIRQVLIEHGDSEVLINNLLESSDHPYRCRCSKCKRWWKSMGPDPDTNEYGPFSRAEIERGPRLYTCRECGEESLTPNTGDIRRCSHCGAPYVDVPEITDAYT